MKEFTYKLEVGGKEVQVELGKYCGQASGHCMLRCGDTVVMVNATMSQTPSPGIGFFSIICVC